jgi:hypothetical protein
MPKKPSTLLVMKDYPPMSSRRWYPLGVDAVSRMNKGEIRFDLSVLSEPKQAGRKVVHRVPAVLAPNSPLSQFLADGFGIHLGDNEPLDLATLAGRSLRARFTKPGDTGAQEVAAVRPCDGADHACRTTVDMNDDQEVTGGLG